MTVETSQGTADTFALPTPGWTVLTEPSDTAPTPVWSMRRVIGQLVVAILVVVGVVGVVGALVTRRLAEQQAVHDSAQLTDVLAESTVQPALTDAVVTSPAGGGALDRAVRRGVLSATLVRVKLWDRSGRIVYSDEPRLIGQTFPLDDEARASFAGPRTQADVSNLKAPENRFEQTKGKLLEVYRPVWTPNGTPLLFEAYYRYDVVTSRSSALWRAFSGIMLSSLAAVFVLLIPIAWALVQRGRRAQRQREAAMHHAVEASQDERRRIAGTLHDGVVQQLAAASFAIAGDAERAARRGELELAAGLRATAGTVRTTMAGMRSLLVDLYPPSLRSAGLAPALRDLAGTASGTDVQVSLDVDAALAEELEPEVQESVYRVAQECLRNAAKHAGAQTVAVRLSGHERFARLEVSDDGVGFDPAAATRERAAGHLGLDLLVDAARRVGGRLEVRSAPSHGAAFRLDVPR